MTSITRRAFGALTVTGLLALTACASVTGQRPAANVAQLTARTPELSTFTKLAQQAGLQATLEGAGPITVFAPSDEAFKELPAATLDKVSKDPEALKALLNFHVVPGLVKAADVTGATTLTTQQGAKLNVSKAGEFLTVEDGLVTQADLAAGNGVVHVIDHVLTPPAAKK